MPRQVLRQLYSIVDSLMMAPAEQSGREGPHASMSPADLSGIRMLTGLRHKHTPQREDSIDQARALIRQSLSSLAQATTPGEATPPPSSSSPYTPATMGEGGEQPDARMASLAGSSSFDFSLDTAAATSSKDVRVVIDQR